MKKNESFLNFSEVKPSKKDNSDNSSTGITRRLLEKYKSKKDFIVVEGAKKTEEFNVAA